MRLSVLSLLCLISLTLCSSSCQPFGLRLFYGDVLTNPTSSDYVTLNFDTTSPCLMSFVRLETYNGQTNLPCETKTVETSKNMKHYTTYIHRCPLQGIQFGERFRYTVFGWTGKDRDIL